MIGTPSLIMKVCVLVTEAYMIPSAVFSSSSTWSCCETSSSDSSSDSSSSAAVSP